MKEFERIKMVVGSPSLGEVLTQIVFVVEDRQKIEKNIQRIFKNMYIKLESMSTDIND